MRLADTKIYRSSVLQRFDCEAIHPVSPRSEGVEVLIDGVTYCRFADYEAAAEAEKLWQRHWPALGKRTIAIVGLSEKLRLVHYERFPKAGASRDREAALFSREPPPAPPPRPPRRVIL